MRILELERRPALAHPDVEVVHGDRAHTHPDFARPRLGNRHVLEAQHLGAAVLAQHHRGHRHARDHTRYGHPMRVVAVPCLKDNYAYLVIDGSTCAVVDPGEAAPVIEAITREDVRLAAIW